MSEETIKNKTAIYVRFAYPEKEAEEIIKEISFSAKQSMDDGLPGEHGGFIIQAENGYIAQTSGGVIYGYVETFEGGMSQCYALLGYSRKGSLSSVLEKAEWRKTKFYDWIFPFCDSVSGDIKIKRLHAPSL